MKANRISVGFSFFVRHSWKLPTKSAGLGLVMPDLMLDSKVSSDLLFLFNLPFNFSIGSDAGDAAAVDLLGVRTGNNSGHPIDHDLVTK